jgi:hypothetical protein
MYDRKGLQIMLSNMVRIYKQFGPGWYLFQMLGYTFNIPLFFIGSFIENLFHARNPFRDFTWAAKFTRNVFILWRYMPKVLSNKPYFYKVL